MKDLLKYYQALQPFLRERMGELQSEDDYYCLFYKNKFVCLLCSVSPNANSCKHMVRIPRTIDDSSPEAQRRSLWGMLDWKRVNMHLSERGDVCINTRLRADPLPVIWAAIPTEAILKALCAQWNVEVEG